MVSPAQAHKLAGMRARAPSELPKVRACAKVILAQKQPEGQAAQEALTALRAVVGPIWGVGTALQYMSGQQAEMAVECAPKEEQGALDLARHIALEVLANAPHGQQAAERVQTLLQAMVSIKT